MCRALKSSIANRFSSRAGDGFLCVRSVIAGGGILSKTKIRNVFLKLSSACLPLRLVVNQAHSDVILWRSVIVD